MCFPNPCFHADEEQALDIAGQLPLDIIVANEDIECLLQLLRTSRTSTYAREEIGPVTILCDLNDWRALQLLLKSSVPLGNLSVSLFQLSNGFVWCGNFTDWKLVHLAGPTALT